MRIPSPPWFLLAVNTRWLRACTGKIAGKLTLPALSTEKAEKIPPVKNPLRSAVLTDA
jgi:hypothetical protein